LKIIILVQEDRLEEARIDFGSLEKLEQSQYVGQLGLALAAAALGDVDGAVARIERAYDERDPQLPFIKILPVLGHQRAALAHPRVQAVIRKLGLPP
jgi:hypothetical protein